MTNGRKTALCLGASAAALLFAPAPTWAQDAENVTLGEVVVTATRRNESLQEVPVVVTAITGEQLQDLNITEFDDIQVLSPGLSFADRGAGGNVTSLRGISTTVVTSAPPAVVIYFNEVPINDLLAFQSIYDIGQIEVVRGPQGTLRGVPAPAGSITINTRRPDLNEYGGTADLTFTDQRALNAQFGLNVPLVEDKLALRLSGLFDRNRAGDVENPVTGARSDAETESVRASVMAQPLENLSIFGSYQYLHSQRDSLAIVEGPGLGFNGPAIGSGTDRLAVQEAVSPRRTRAHLASVRAQYDLGAATLSYVGGYSKFDSLTRANEGDNDAGNAIVGYSQRSKFDVEVESTTHEVRLDSTGEDRFWDYTLGAFYERSKGDTFVNNAIAPSGLNIEIALPSKTDNKSVFGSSTFHLPTRTDVTVGARHIWYENFSGFTGDIRFGDFPLGLPQVRDDTENKFNTWVYDARVAQHVNDDVLAYVSYSHG
jgi:iron complex outermembrane receptor protein